MRGEPGDAWNSIGSRGIAVVYLQREAQDDKLRLMMGARGKRRAAPGDIKPNRVGAAAVGVSNGTLTLYVCERISRN